VWAPGLTITGGHLVLDVLDVAWPHARLLTLLRPGTEPVALNILYGGEHWAMADGGI
jgi:hypothetical protein